MTTKIKLKETNSGFALLLTLVVITIILAVGLTLLQITMKQLSLSAIARESEIAFYAASTGIECMQYWRSFPPTRAALLHEGWDGQAYDPDEPLYLECADTGPVSYEEVTSLIDDNVYGYKYSYNLSNDPLSSTDDTCVDTSIYLAVADADSDGTIISRSFEGNQGPWEDQGGSGWSAPTLVTGVTGGDIIKMVSFTGTWSERVGVSSAERSCDAGVLSFTNSSNNQISKVRLSNTTGGYTVPNGATRAYVSVDEAERNWYHDNSGNWDNRAACVATFGLNPTEGSDIDIGDISDLNEGLNSLSCDAGNICTTIFSRGYNRPCGEGLNSIFTVQRELTIEY